MERLIFLLMFMMSFNEVICQTNGLVTDKKGLPIEEVNVFYADQNLLIQTNNDGSFAFDQEIPKSSYLHIYKYGFASRLIRYKDQKDLNITLDQLHIDLDEVGVQIDESHSNTINITDDIKMIMKYPQMIDIKLNNVNTNETESVFEILQKCILEVHNGDEIINSIDMKPKEISEFIDSLNTEQFESVMQFFNTMPKVRHIVEVTNPKTKVTGEVLLEGLQSFLE